MIGCPVDAYTKDPATGIVAAQRRHLHRLPVLHLELLLRRAAVQPRARRRRQVRHVPQPARARAGAGLRVRLPGRRDRHRDRQRSTSGARDCAAATAPGLPSADDSISTTRITLPAICRPNARPVDLTHVTPEHPHWPLVFMLVLTQLSVGAFATIWLLDLLGVGAAWRRRRCRSLLVAASGAGGVHAASGPSVYAYRALKMWRRSWLSREVLLLLAVRGVACGVLPAMLLASTSVAAAASARLRPRAGLGGRHLLSARIYRVPSRPGLEHAVHAR